MGHPNRAADDWIPEDEYDAIQSRVPIVCVDLLPLDAPAEAVGLIRRKTYEEQEGWCLIGGGVRKNEKLEAAIARHVRSSLGDRFHYELPSSQPLFVAEYFPDRSVGALQDPRKHAVALSYAAVSCGEAKAQGEALEFRWFRRHELKDISFGFGQGAVVEKLVARIDREATTQG